MARQARRGWAGLGVAIVALALPAGAFAHSGEFAKFDDCPTTTVGVAHCLYSVTGGGEVLLGKTATPIVNKVILQGGYSKENAEHVSTFFAASDGQTLTKAPQPVPGGLLGIVPPASSPPLLKALAKRFFESKWTGVNATLELAGPASAIKISTFNLLVEEGLALQVPVKIHLENPFLGGSCYVGSDRAPIVYSFTTGFTSPPPPNQPIEGNPGFIELKEEARIAELTQTRLVDNSWAAPKASGCGGVLAPLVDPIIDARIGLPSAAGHNAVILENTVDTATPAAVNSN
ncbi:MAG: hypothetical protein WB709_02305 [Solirubrobacteraceae bacterium]